MKSTKKIQEEYKINQKQLLEALRKCCSHYLSEDEVRVFILKELKKSHRIN